MQYPFRFLCGLVVSLFVFQGTATAQTQPPDAGILLQEQRQLAPSLPDRLPAPEKPGIIPPPLTDTGVKVLVKGFRFTGSFQGLVTEGELQDLVKDSLGKELGFAELQHLVGRITNYLREKKGFLLARATLPKQDVTEGIIEITIIAGRIDGKVRLKIKPPARIHLSLLEGMAQEALPEGSPARLESIERAVLLMNDLPGINAQASLEPGDQPGSTRIIIETADSKAIRTGPWGNKVP